MRVVVLRVGRERGLPLIFVARYNRFITRFTDDILEIIEFGLPCLPDAVCSRTQPLPQPEANTPDRRGGR